MHNGYHTGRTRQGGQGQIEHCDMEKAIPPNRVRRHGRACGKKASLRECWWR